MVRKTEECQEIGRGASASLKVNDCRQRSRLGVSC